MLLWGALFVAVCLVTRGATQEDEKQRSLELHRVLHRILTGKLLGRLQKESQLFRQHLDLQKDIDARKNEMQGTEREIERIVDALPSDAAALSTISGNARVLEAPLVDGQAVSKTPQVSRALPGTEDTCTVGQSEQQVLKLQQDTKAAAILEGTASDREKKWELALLGAAAEMLRRKQRVEEDLKNVQASLPRGVTMDEIFARSAVLEATKEVTTMISSFGDTPIGDGGRAADDTERTSEARTRLMASFLKNSSSLALAHRRLKTSEELLDRDRKAEFFAKFKEDVDNHYTRAAEAVAVLQQQHIKACAHMNERRFVVSSEKEREERLAQQVLGTIRWIRNAQIAFGDITGAESQRQ
ncbi:hypothetical protein cyc_05511 [Cyclospora cayetanensis]|uniref:Uncharacterized protein n=1 Tax=Cyclospora cayetanensis TaxID=88456 RepID=A0A1D3D1Q8_9EIME|nr:hypothetical protein cyc_05511 [Cyclospora cayetanensis]